MPKLFVPEIINTTKQISDLVDWLVFRHANVPAWQGPTMYIDLEGVDLCRKGSLSIFTLLISTGITITRICLIDVHTLGAQAFETRGTEHTTLKDILQDEKIPKVFFDVRNDFDVLFAHFGIALQGIEDVQLMESATRKTTYSRKFVSGLAKCVENNVFNHKERANWLLLKEKGERLFLAKYGGSYEVFNQRPMLEDIVSYCVGDVKHLPELRERFWYNLAYRWKDLVREKSQERVALSQRADYQPHGSDRAVAPWSSEQNKLLDQRKYVPAHCNDFDDLFDTYDDEDD